MVQVRRELYLYRQREDDSSSSSSGDDSEGHDDDSSESEDEELSCSDSLDDSTDTSEEEDVVDDEPMMEDGTVNFATSKTREHNIVLQIIELLPQLITNFIKTENFRKTERICHLTWR